MMASLLPPVSSNGAERLSQILPSVKCSNCNAPVPLSELGDHICKPSSGPVSAAPKPSAPAPASLLPARFQRSPAPGPVSQPQPPPPTKPRSPPIASQPVPVPAQPPRHGTPAQDKLRADTQSAAPPRSSPLIRTDIMNGDLRQNDPFAPNPMKPLRPHPSPDMRQRSVSNVPPPPQVAASPRLAPSPLNSDARGRAFSSSSQMGNAVQPISSPMNPSSMSTNASPISNAGLRNTPPRPSFTANPPPPIRVPPTPTFAQPAFVPGTPVDEHIDTKSGGEAGMAGVGRRGFAAAARAAFFAIPSTPNLYAPQPGRIGSVSPLDFAQNQGFDAPFSPASAYPPRSPFPRTPISPVSPGSIATFNQPAQVPFSDDHNVNTMIQKRATPPPLNIVKKKSSPDPELSTDSSTASPPQLRMSFFKKFKTDAGDDTNDTPNPYDNSATQRRDSMSEASRYSDSPPRPLRRRPTFVDPPSSPSESGSEHGLAYAESTDCEDDDDEDDDEDAKSIPSRDAVTPLPQRMKSILKNRNVNNPSDPNPEVRADRPGVKFGGEQRSRSSSASSSESANRRSVFSRIVSVGGPGALDRAMETLLEELPGLPNPYESTDATRNRSGSIASTTSRTSGSSNVLLATTTLAKRSNTVQSPDSRRSLKLPTRSKTGPPRESSALQDTERHERRVKKAKVCLKCDKKIEDGRWVQVDAGGVLCEKCWKNMYLPKCRRCDLPIEKQAVSSSDGQLKGKYHRECFSCHICFKPFPDKTFYVFDGKPHCAYHYHEANESLCAAARCGQPIEGPCAVSHTGDKYHPEHLTCEWPGTPPGTPGCTEKLADYWEVDGQMLCERHALHIHQRRRRGSDYDDDEEVDEEWQQSSKAMKRTTKFIDLVVA